MRHNPGDRFIDSGLDLVRTLDPELHARMLLEEWELTENLKDAADRYAGDIGEYRSIRGQIGYSFGLTLPRQPGIWVPHCTINQDYITRWARKEGVRPAAMAAATLAHEFKHIYQPVNMPAGDREWEASLAGEDLAERLAPEDARPILEVSRWYRMANRKAA